MLVCPGPFLLTVKLHHHLSPAIQVFNKGVSFGSWCFTDPSKFTFKTFIVFLVIIGEKFFLQFSGQTSTFFFQILGGHKNPFYEKPFSSFSFCNFALLSVHMLLWPFLLYLFPSSCSSFFSTINGKLLGFIFKGTINTACVVITHAEFALSFSSLFPWYLLHCLWLLEKCSLMNSRQMPILFLSHAKILCSTNPCP